MKQKLLLLLILFAPLFILAQAAPPPPPPPQTEVEANINRTGDYLGQNVFYHTGSTGVALSAQSNYNGKATGAVTTHSRSYLSGYSTIPLGGSGNFGAHGNVTGIGGAGWGVIASNGLNLGTPDTYAALAGKDYSGIFSGGFIGYETTTPESDFHINQSGGYGEDEQTGGICFETPSAKWRIYNSGLFFRFNFKDDNGGSYAPKAYISHTDGSWNMLSDATLKSHVESVGTVLDAVKKLQVKKYRYLDNPINSKKSIGLIAQEVQKIFPELVSSEKDGGLLGINYQGFGVIAIKAIQEQQEIIDNQQAQLNNYKKELDQIKAEILATKEANKK